MKNHMATCILYEGFLYGFDDAIFRCLDVQTGKTKWKKRGLGEGSLLFADDHFITLSDKGDLVLVEATPEAYKQVGDAGKILKGDCWSVPTLAGGQLFLRDMTQIVCLDLNGS